MKEVKLVLNWDNKVGGFAALECKGTVCGNGNVFFLVVVPWEYTFVKVNQNFIFKMYIF